ncbi:BRCA1 protein, partial [Dromaius novaehollandiae]|nr:BRCA1 protein [Dromaius novaehollandiae]
FPRFCMFKLLSKKKKGVIQCPLCKTEVTKRSLQENSRFKQLIEGLLETIHAFELDTGVKFLNSHHFSKTSIEANAAEALCKESSIIQSRGFRNRKKRAKENGQENCTLEANADPQLTDSRVKRCPLRNRNQKCDSDTGIYIEFGKSFYKEVLQLSSQEKLEELKRSEKGNEYSCKIQPVKLRAKEIILPNVIGESDFLKEGLSKKSTQNITEHAKPGQVNVTECQSSPLNVLAADLLAEQCDRVGNASPLRKGDMSFFKNTEEMDAEQTQCNNKSKESDLEDSSEGKLDKSKEIDIVVQCVEDVEMCEPENDSFPEEESSLEKPEMLHSDTLNQISRKRLKRSIQKVNEWFSKSNEILSSNSSQDDPAEATDTSAEGDACLSDKDSCISEKTNLMVNCMEIAVIEKNKKLSKQTADSIKDKIFGKTYKRGRKSNPPVTLRETLPTAKNDAAADEKCLNNSRTDKPKRKRKTACVLQPEDFIKKKDLEEADGCPQNVNRCLGEAEKKNHDESSAVIESSVTEKRKDNTLAELGEEESVWKNATEEVTCESDGVLEPNNCDQKGTKKTRSSLAKKCRHSTRTMHALQLVVGRNSGSPDPAEPQIDSYPSSEEPRKVDSEHRQVRRSRRLQLLAEEMTKETGKRRVLTEGAGKYDGRSGGSFSGVQRNVLVHSSECQDLGEQQDMLTYRPATNLKSAELEADEIQISLKNSSDTVDTGKSLFNPTFSCQHSNYGSAVPDTDSQEGEMLGSPFLLQPPSVNVVQTASQVTKEKTTEACATFPQGDGHYTDNVPEDFRNEKSPMAKNVFELTKEAEDSELDTQYLRNMFRHSKRLSFTLYPSPMKASVVEDAASETLKMSCADQVENKHSKYLKTENLQVEKTNSENLSRFCEKEKLKTYESLCISPVSCFVSNTEYMHTGEHRENISQVADQGNLTSPIRIGATRVENKNKQQTREQVHNKTVSTDIVVESELSQNPFECNISQSDQSNTQEHVFQRINTVNEIGFSSESNQAEKAEVDEGKGPILLFHPPSMICPTVCQQSPVEFNCKGMEKKDSKREGKQGKSNEEQVTQTGSTGMPKCLISEALEEPLKGSTDFPGLSETPDGLLCSDDDTEENSSFCETDRKERSAVFVKRSDSALVKELDGKNVNSTPISQGIQRSRRRARKLQSSEEESSEDDNLPCFQTLIFGKSASTPLQFNKQVTSVVGSSVHPSTLPQSGSHNDHTMQKTPEAALSTGCVSPSQESECSVNLFSSQSNMSEESVDGARELKKPLTLILSSKQMSNQNDSKETFQGCSGGLKKRKANLTDEYQEDPNIGANLGEASGYDSETSHVEDSSGPFSQAEILTTQQKNAMQNNLKKLQQEMAVLEAVLKQHESQDSEFLPLCKELPHSSSKGELRTEQMRQVRENASDEKSGTKRNGESVLSNLCGNVSRSPNSSSSSIKLLHPQTAEATNSSAVAQNANRSCNQGCKRGRSVCFPTSVLHNTAGKENATSPVVTNRREMSIVASGLNQSEHLVVQKFARKTRSTLSNHITEGTTHVIMKTDIELVCERTLKYFLGIAGRKWVVSYQWVVQSFKEGRILDEDNFEVRGDVINGRNHQGPKRARQSLTEKIFKDFEICCYGPFTDMTTEHLEWMVELCGASVVKQLHLFTHKTNSTAVVVVQPDAWVENTGYRAIQQKKNVAVVTREWVLDSVACYECQEFDAYLVS